MPGYSDDKIAPQERAASSTHLLFWLPLVLISLGSCSLEPVELRLHPPATGAADAATLQLIFEQKSRLRVVSAQVDDSRSGLELLANREVDLALIENSSPFQAGVRVVLPVYISVLHLLIREDLDFSDPVQPLRGTTIFINNGSPAGRAFTRMVASKQGLEEGQYRIVSELVPGETDLIIYFGPINTRNPSWYVPGYRLYSLDYDDTERAMSSKAIAYLMPQMQPKVIPAHTYDLPGNEKDVHTVAVDALLATHKNTSVNVIYELTRTLLEQKPRFTAVAPAAFAGVREDFDPLSLNFPLHEGSRRYLARDEPSALERYAESINLLVYLVFLVLTGAVGLTRWHAHRKKDRVDAFYSRIFAIRMRAMHEPQEQLRIELRQLELEAFESLITEKLAADESFRIFIELLTRAMAELERDGPADSQS
ncbi:MAG: hypothetical protein O7F73_04055 [Gammaproteobacteria bacterium]|nr:hypothetical protein [Gammaproteobacteria bacterium]